MAVKQFKSNDSRELTLQILVYLASIQKKGLIPTDIKRLDDDRYLYAYEVRSKVLMATA